MATLLVATALHVGFQLTVSVLVYPALVRTPASLWPKTQRQHSRAIVWLVVLVYGMVLLASAGALWSAPDTWWVWLSCGASAGAFAVTATRAAPLHGQLGRVGPEPDLLAALLLADRVRLALALVAMIGAIGALSTR